MCFSSFIDLTIDAKLIFSKTRIYNVLKLKNKDTAKHENKLKLDNPTPNADKRNKINWNILITTNCTYLLTGK